MAPPLLGSLPQTKEQHSVGEPLPPTECSDAPVVSDTQGDNVVKATDSHTVGKMTVGSSAASLPVACSEASSTPGSKARLDHGDLEKDTLFKQILSAKDWSGPDDPGNAQNWPAWQKIFHTYIVSGTGLVATFASSAITPGLKQIASDYHVSAETATLAYAIYVLGLGVGGPLASPLSEALGRKYVFLTCLPVFSLFILGTGFSPNIGSLIVCRFFSGFFGAPAFSVGSGTIADIYPPQSRSLPMSLSVLAPFLGPALGPLIGGFVVVHEGWRWTSWTVLFFTVALIVPTLVMKETYKRQILKNRARKLKVEGPEGLDKGKTKAQVITAFVRSGLTRPIHMLFTEPVVASFTFYTSFNFALVYAFFAAFPYVFETYYDFSIESTGLTFIGLGVGCIIAFCIIMFVDLRIYQPKVLAAAQQETIKGATSKVPPEQRLYLALLGGPLITVGLFIFGWTAFVRVHWIAPVIGEGLFGCGNLLVFMSATMYIMDTYGPLYGASAMAANSLTRYVMGTIFPLFAVQMFKGMGVQWACTLLGCVSLAWCVVPWVLWSYGIKLRSRTGYKHGN